MAVPASLFISLLISPVIKAAAAFFRGASSRISVEARASVFEGFACLVFSLFTPLSVFFSDLTDALDSFCPFTTVVGSLMETPLEIDFLADKSFSIVGGWLNLLDSFAIFMGLGDFTPSWSFGGVAAGGAHCLLGLEGSDPEVALFRL